VVDFRRFVSGGRFCSAEAGLLRRLILTGMRERAAVYDGTVSAGPAAGGWHVHADLPMGEGAP
jgi:hypothetical protein